MKVNDQFFNKLAARVIFVSIALVNSAAWSDAVSVEQSSRALATPDKCHPLPEAGKPQYIVGYGSLMEEASRLRTAPNAGVAMPVRVEGYRRAWIARAAYIGVGTTFLGVLADSKSRISAVLFSMFDESEIVGMDSREQGYCRAKIDANRILMLNNSVVPDGEFWIYVNRDANIARPSKALPIVQSYVDVFLSGCLQIERNHSIDGFARECVRSTHGWSKHWVNDRIYPRRPMAQQPNAKVIDKLLDTELPQYFRTMRIE